MVLERGRVRIAFSFVNTGMEPVPVPALQALLRTHRAKLHFLLDYVFFKTSVSKIKFSSKKNISNYDEFLKQINQRKTDRFFEILFFCKCGFSIMCILAIQFCPSYFKKRHRFIFIPHACMLKQTPRSSLDSPSILICDW